MDELPIGQRVRIDGLASRADLNGSHAIVTKYLEDRDRYQVCPERGSTSSFALKRANLHTADGVLGGIDGELLRTFVLPCFEAPTALILTQVCRSWNEQVSSASAYWKDCCIRFAMKEVFVKTAPNFGQGPSPLPPRSLDQYIAEDFSNKDMRRMLFFAGIDLSECVERSDFRRRIRTLMLLGDPHDNFDWAKKINEWKATYFFLRRDKSRTKIEKAEACALKWRIHFMHQGTRRRLNAFFNEDGTMWSELQPDAKHCWDVVAGEGGCWVVQVAHYPPLYISRNSDGSWVMANDYVSLSSVHGDDDEEEDESSDSL